MALVADGVVVVSPLRRRRRRCMLTAMKTVFSVGWSVVRYVVGALMTVSGLLQLVALPGDLATWLTWLPRLQSSLAANSSTAVNVAILIVGLALLVSGSISGWATRGWPWTRRPLPPPHIPPRSMTKQLDDMRREQQQAGETFAFVQGDLRVVQYTRAALDALASSQRDKLFLHAPEMRAWWRGRQRDGSWPRFRLDGGYWFSKQEIGAMTEQERNDVLTRQTEMIDWYLEGVQF